MRILVVNAGSSSLKYQLMESETGEIFAKGICERIAIPGSFVRYTRTGDESIVEEMPLPNHQVAMERVLHHLTDKEHGAVSSMSEIAAVGHRVLHAGEAFAGSYVVTEDVLAAVREMIPLGPLHNPANLAGIEACQAAMPGTPQVAVFDTAFHQTMPPKAYLYGLSYECYEKYRVRRYGFHGTSHQYVSQRAAELMGKPVEDLKIVTAHLGNGSSLAAVQAGKCVDTSMGLTPLAGVPMGTRCGDIDPAIVRYLMQCNPEWTIDDVDHLMNKESGMKGLSGISSDFRDLCEAEDAGNERALLALDIFGYQIAKYVGAYAAAMNGLNGLVFTAGVGEHTPSVRRRVCEYLTFLGLEIDAEKNENAPRGQEFCISTPNSKVEVWIIPTNEELMIAMDTARLVSEL